MLLPTQLKKILRLWPYAMLLLAVFLVYSNVYDNDFLFDDEFLIQKNQFIRSWDYLLKIFMTPSTAGSGGTDSFYRPLQGFLYLIVFQIFGQSTLGFHLLNILIHAANALLVYSLGLKLNFKKNASLLAALIWAVHPMHTEAVTYQSATADSLHTFWILIGLLLLIPSFSRRRIFVACGVFALAIISKESAVVFPLLVMSVIFLRSDKPWDWRSYIITWPLWIMVGIYLVLRKTLLNFDDTFNFYKVTNIYTENLHYRIYTFFATLPSYVELMVFPHDLRMERGFPVFIDPITLPVMLGAVLVLIFALQLALAKKGRGKILAWAGLWFFFAQIPHTGILLPVNSFFLEHWMYLPSIGLFLGVFQAGSTLGIVKNYPRISVAFVMLAMAALGHKTYRQNQIWETPIGFYNNILNYGSGTERVHNNLAMAYGDRDNLAKAAEHYLKAIDISGDRSPQPHHNIALILLKLDQVDAAIAHLKRAIEINPRFYYSYAVLADIYRQQGKIEESNKYLQGYKELTKTLPF